MKLQQLEFGWQGSLAGTGTKGLEAQVLSLYCYPLTLCHSVTSCFERGKSAQRVTSHCPQRGRRRDLASLPDRTVAEEQKQWQKGREHGRCGWHLPAEHRGHCTSMRASQDPQTKETSPKPRDRW